MESGTVSPRLLLLAALLNLPFVGTRAFAADAEPAASSSPRTRMTSGLSISIGSVGLPSVGSTSSSSSSTQSGTAQGGLLSPFGGGSMDSQ